MDDVFLVLSFGANTHQNLPYYGHKYALVFVYSYDGAKTSTIWHLFKNDKVIKSGMLDFGMFDQSINPMRENDYFRHQESEARPSNYYFKSSLSPVGEKFKIKLRLEDNELIGTVSIEKISTIEINEGEKGLCLKNGKQRI